MTSERWGADNIVRKRVKFARFDDLNDPFELLSANLGERDARRFYNALRTAVSGRFGTICFSDNWRNPVMWAHYGDKHKGLCLGFDVKAADQVQYEPERLLHKIDASQPRIRVTADLIKIAMTTKFSDWCYEHEWRVFQELTKKHADGNYYLEFGGFVELREVIIGARCNLTRRDVAKMVGQPNREVTIIKARPGFTKFEVVTQRKLKPMIVNQRS